MRNIWIICRKELRSYFVSPIAYILLAMFAIVFGWMFWNDVHIHVQAQIRPTFSGTPPTGVKSVVENAVSTSATFAPDAVYEDSSSGLNVFTISALDASASAWFDP